MKKTICCNLFAGPGTGKSTIMAGLFAELKWRNIDCEMATEYAKDKVWEGATDIFNCQHYIFGKQLFRTFRLNKKVQVIVTDSPILLSIIYDKSRSKNFYNSVLEEFNKYNNFNIFLRRVKKYNPNGRFQNLKDAIKLDKEIQSLLISADIPFKAFDGSRETVNALADILEYRVKKQ